MIKNIITSAVVAVAVVILGISFAPQSAPVEKTFGSTMETIRVWLGGGVQIGQTGSKISNEIVTTCNLQTSQLPLEATSSDVFYCSVPGVRSGDKVSVFLPSDNGAIFGAFGITYAKASTTPDFIEVGVNNFTGAASTTFPAATTSVSVRATRTTLY